ncbi:MAG: GNAT family N-acetyltransferase [Promethearchaeota archaeon]
MESQERRVKKENLDVNKLRDNDKIIEHFIYHRNELPSNFFENIELDYKWHYGYIGKTHYLVDSNNKILGCLNLIFLSIYKGTYLFYIDTIEIKKIYRRKHLGTRLMRYVINKISEKYKKYNIFLLVAKCDPNKIRFFSSIGFFPVKLRRTENGLHCIMAYPYESNCELNCDRLFIYFNWREENKEQLSTDCIHANVQNPSGLYWCDKKQIYVTCLEKQTCPYYKKGSEIFFEEKFYRMNKSKIEK